MANENENGQAGGENQENNQEGNQEGQNEGNEGSGNEGNSGTVSKEAHAKALADMHKYKKIAKELEAKQKTAELNKLKETNDWKKVAEVKEQEAKAALEEKERMTKAVVTDKKLSAIREKVIKEGILDAALNDIDMVDWSDVTVETTSTGRLNVLGVDDAVKRMKTLKPHWFGKPAPKINGKIPTTGGDAEVVSLEKLNKLRKEAMKSGDYSTYEPAFKAWNAAQAAKAK